MMKDKYKVLIISCWVLLVLALVAKLAGANIFNIAVNNKRFIDLCNWLDSNLIVKYIVYAIISLILNSFCILAILGQRFYTKIQALIFIPIIIFMSIMAWYSKVTNTILGFVIYLLPIIWLKKRWYRCLIGIAIIYSYELLALLIRNIAQLTLYEENSIIAIVMQIDTLIMSVLYYLHSNALEHKKKLKIESEKGGE